MLTQYKSHRLDVHIANMAHGDLHRRLRDVGAGADAARAALVLRVADAIYQNLNIIDDERRPTSSYSAQITSIAWTRDRCSTVTSNRAQASPSPPSGFRSNRQLSSA